MFDHRFGDNDDEGVDEGVYYAKTYEKMMDQLI